MKKLFFIAAMFAVTGLHAQINYSLSGIPDSLLSNVSVIKRYQKIHFEVNDIERTTQKVHKVVSVLSDPGKRELYFQESISKNRSIEDVEINLYDANGQIQGKYRKKDLQTFAMGGDLINDYHVLYFAVPATRYPVTVEYKYEIKTKGSLRYPSFNIIVPGESVQHSEFTAAIGKSLQMRYKLRNTNLKPEIKEDDKFKTYSWSVKNLPAFRYEEGSLHESAYPTVQLAPSQFKYDEYKGDMSSWNSFGTYFYNLFKDQDKLPAEKVEFFRNLTKDAKTEREKAALIYKYMQDNFRYVSIQLGIGGFVPFSATFTDEKKYGDCKALTNYMLAALKSIGIKSYAADINAGTNGVVVDTDFPEYFANHVILCVPLAKDTVWLECTSKTADFGVLGTFTENRKAVLLTEKGGILVSTPKSKAEDNIYACYTEINLQPDANGKVQQQIYTSGEYLQYMQSLLNEKDEKIKEFAVFYLGLKQPDVLSMTPKVAGNAKNYQVEASYEKIPEFVAGSKMFLAPRIYKFWSKKLPKSENRKTDYYFNHPFILSDTTRFNIPKDFTVDALPKSKSIECEYATFTSSYIFDQASSSVISTAKLVLKQHQIPAAKYEEVKKFFDEVLAEDSQRLVVKKG
jgi:transglutaminase-like putative cysteine protease